VAPPNVAGNNESALKLSIEKANSKNRTFKKPESKRTNDAQVSIYSALSKPVNYIKIGFCAASAAARSFIEIITI